MLMRTLACLIASGLLAAAPAAAAPACAAPPPAGAQALTFAAAAAAEHQAYGGPLLDGENRLVESGPSEAEHSATGTPPWQRVLGYWQAVPPLDGREPRAVRGATTTIDRHRLHQAVQQASAARLQGLGVGPDEGLQPHELDAARAAIDRVAVVDTPWSAAFVSWVARRAGLRDDQFTFSDAHADYAASAVLAGAPEAAAETRPVAYAFRACDAAATPVRVGDLVCQGRARAATLDTFAALAKALRDRSRTGAPLPMHCDIVVAVDATGFDTVGGNVINAVTRRRFDLAHTAPGRLPWVLSMQWR